MHDLMSTNVLIVGIARPNIVKEVAKLGAKIRVIEETQLINNRINDLRLLENAGAYDANLLVAATSSDSVNLTICQYAKNVFKIPKVIAVINNPDRPKIRAFQRVSDSRISLYKDRSKRRK